MATDQAKVVLQCGQFRFVIMMISTGELVLLKYDDLLQLFLLSQLDTDVINTYVLRCIAFRDV